MDHTAQTGWIRLTHAHSPPPLAPLAPPHPLTCGVLLSPAAAAAALAPSSLVELWEQGLLLLAVATEGWE